MDSVKFSAEERALRAKEFFIKGYNCAQSVALAYADVTSLDEEMVAKITASFGGGMGRLREVCGAVSGMAFVASLCRVSAEHGQLCGSQCHRAAPYPGAD